MSVSDLKADDPTIVSRYLGDQLTEAERKAFEARLISDPDALQELEATARLKVGLQRLRDTGELPSLLRSAPPFGKPSLLALAAALGMLVIGVALLRMSAGISNPPVLAAVAAALVDEQGNPLPVTATKAMFARRTEGYDAVLQQALAPQAVALRLLPPRTQVESQRYRVSLFRVRDEGVTEFVSSTAGLQPTADGFVTVFVDTSRLEAGRYRLEIVGETSIVPAGAEGTFSIRVVPAATN